MSKCFVIMPITTPQEYLPIYHDDIEHFNHVLEALFSPALMNLGYSVIPPKIEGSNIIHAEIIKNIADSDLVLCNMSILNPNVFFELGIRTALDKPVVLVVDNITNNLPFDTSIINYHKYESSLNAWSINNEINKLTGHIRASLDKISDKNSLWKYFGVSQYGNFKPDQYSMEDKIDLIMKKLEVLEENDNYNLSSKYLKDELMNYEKDKIIKILGETEWNISLAAQMLGISRPTLYDKMNKYKINKN